MLSILEEPEVRHHVFPISVADYHEMGRLGLVDKDVELLEGVIVYKMSKSALQETLVEALRRALDAIVPSGYFIGKERPITCANSEPEPDLALFRGDWRDFRSAHPTTAELVIEIAISTVGKDTRKALCYSAAGVKEYWLVEPETKRLTIFTNPSASGYQNETRIEYLDLAGSGVLPGFQVRLTDLFVD